MMQYLLPAAVPFVLGIVTTTLCRRPVAPANIPPSPSAPPKLDLENPYAAGATPVDPNLPAWSSLRSRCRWLRMANTICWTLAFMLPFKPVGEEFLDQFPNPQRFLALIVLTPVIVILSLVLQLIWESPTRNKAASFARAVLSQRRVPPEHMGDQLFIGLSNACTGERIGNSSDGIGFLHLTERECVLHTTENDGVIPRESVVGLARVAPKDESMAWIGLRVVGLTWKPEDDTERTLYLIAWGGETSFAIKRATARLYDQLAAWRSSPPPPQEIPPVLR